MDSIQLYHDFLLSLTIKNLQWYGPWTLEQLRNRAGSRTRWTESQVCTLVYLCEGWIAWTQSCRCLSIPLKHKQKAHPVVRHLQPVADKCHIHQVSATAFRCPSTVQRQTTKGRREINKKMCHTWGDSKTWKLFQCLPKGRNIVDLILTACLCRHYGCFKCWGIYCFMHSVWVLCPVLESSSKQLGFQCRFYMQVIKATISPAKKQRNLQYPCIDCTKRVSQARILLPVGLRLNQSFIGSSRTSRREVQLLCEVWVHLYA